MEKGLAYCRLYHGLGRQLGALSDSAPESNSASSVPPWFLPPVSVLTTPQMDWELKIKSKQTLSSSSCFFFDQSVFAQQQKSNLNTRAQCNGIRSLSSRRYYRKISWNFAWIEAGHVISASAQKSHLVSTILSMSFKLGGPLLTKPLKIYEAASSKLVHLYHYPPQTPRFIMTSRLGIWISITEL